MFQNHPNSLKKYRMLIAYDGTDYSGWQVQPNSHSIQGLIEQALHTLLKRTIRIIGAGRTDAGVHAKGQVAHFHFYEEIDCHRTLYALNGLLPKTIRIQLLEPAAPTFHAQYSALSKEYHYHLWLERTIDPFLRLYRHHFFDRRFSLPALEAALPYFVGCHDFASFANVGGHVKSTVRTLNRLEVYPQEGGLRLEVEGDGFLYKMVRNIVGLLLEISTGKQSHSTIPLLFAQKNRQAAGMAAPAQGLFLIRVNY